MSIILTVENPDGRHTLFRNGNYWGDVYPRDDAFVHIVIFYDGDMLSVYALASDWRDTLKTLDRLQPVPF